MIVLDTHTVIWLTDERAKLSKTAERALIQGRNDGSLAIADITLREIAFLIARGSVLVSEPAEVYLKFVEALFRVLPIDAKIAAQSMRFSDNYSRDPADQLIGATAVVHRAKLITKDERIRASGEVNCIW